MSIDIGTVTVLYERSPLKQWIAQNGTLITTAPPGARGKLYCVREAIRHEDPALFQLSSQLEAKHPTFTSRIWKAAIMIVNGHIKPPRPGNLIHEVALIGSQTTDDQYSVHYYGNYTCGCEDFQLGKAPSLPKTGQKMCKHIIAYAAFKRLGRIEWEVTNEQ